MIGGAEHHQALVEHARDSQPVPMIDDREIWACAIQLMRMHGEDAWFHASQRADELFDDGDHEGGQVWSRILACITTLEERGEARLQ